MAERLPKVAVGFVHRDEQVTSFVESLSALVTHDRAHLNLLAHDASRMSVRAGTDGLVAARNTIAEQFAASDVDWLLVVDTDMGFAPDTLYRLLAVADPAERPVVGALCFAQRQFAHDGMNGYRTRPVPTIYDWLPGDDGVPRFASVPLYPVNQLVRVAGTGAACILIHRSVVERIAERYGPTWYTRTPGTDGKLLGEDISFCVRCSSLDIPLHVYTGVRTTHYKSQWLSESDHWMRYVPPPADRPAAVIAAGPTEEFARSLRASTGLATCYQNLAESEEPWVVLAAGDERWRPGWLDHAQQVADTFGVPVVGINNPADPACADGSSASTVLVAREYLDAHGAEGLVRGAQERGDWAMALGAIAERDLQPEPVAPERGWTVSRYAIIPTHNRPARLLALVASLGTQCDGIIVLDNASEPPVDEMKLKAAASRCHVKVVRDPEQPPHLSRFWNVMLDRIAEDADGPYDVAILNDDSLVPAGWYDACSTGLRGHDTAVIAHTSPTSPALLTEVHNDPGNRMTPHAFVIRGELGMRADESMRWWYFDSDLDQRARLAGGVLSVAGPRVTNALANTTTVGPLAAQAERDRIVFEKKWANR